MAHYVSPAVDLTVEALTDREGKQANTSFVQEEILRNKSFPPNDGEQYYELPPAVSPHTRATEEVVQRPLYCKSA